MQQHRHLTMNEKSKSFAFCLSPCLFVFFTPPPAASPLFTPLDIHSAPPPMNSSPSHSSLFHVSAAKPPLCPSFPSFTPSIPPPLSVLWWGAGWPWIPLLLWGNNRRSLLLLLLLCAPLSPTWGPQSTGKEGAREKENTSWVCGRDGEWERERGIKAVTQGSFIINVYLSINSIYIIYFLQYWN